MNTTVDHATCAECGQTIYRHADVRWLHNQTGLVWCYRDAHHTETARP